MNKDKLVRLFEESFGTVGVRNLLSVHAPGRSEIAGNHTDHEGGHVIAAALDVAVDCIAANNGTATVRVASEGYPQIEVDLDSLDSRDDEKGSTAALVRGMAYEVAVRGGTPTGFDLAMTSTIPSGGGLSSSAAVEARHRLKRGCHNDDQGIDEIEHGKPLSRRSVHPLAKSPSRCTKAQVSACPCGWVPSRRSPGTR